MTAKITAAELRQRMQADLDQYAFEHLPKGSLALHAYETKAYPAVRKLHSAKDADAAECRQWDLTPQEWVEEMEAARIALAHDMKLDLIRNDATPAM